MLAKMMAQEGILESRRRRVTRRSPESSPGCSSFFPARIKWNSGGAMPAQSRGLSARETAQTDSHRNPMAAKSEKGPWTPILAVITGEARRLTTLPRWNPAMESPTALALSWLGNHLDKMTIMEGIATPAARPKTDRMARSAAVECAAAPGVRKVASDQRAAPPAMTLLPPNRSARAPPTMDDTRYPHINDDCTPPRPVQSCEKTENYQKKGLLTIK